MATTTSATPPNSSSGLACRADHVARDGADHQRQSYADRESHREPGYVDGGHQQQIGDVEDRAARSSQQNRRRLGECVTAARKAGPWLPILPAVSPQKRAPSTQTQWHSPNRRAESGSADRA